MVTMATVERDWQATYAELFHAHFGGLVRLATLLGADDPEDVVQDAFVRLHRSRRRLRDPARALPYLRTTVVNLSRSRLRHLAVVRRWTPAGPVDQPSAEQTVVAGESQRELVSALKVLSPRQREAVVLRYWLDAGEAEMAELMGVSRGAVKSHLFRAMRALEQTLEATR